MKCENIRLLLTAYLIGEPDAALKKTVDEHLETCCDCRASLQKIRSTLDLVQGALAATQKAPNRLSPEQRKRVLSARPAAPVSWFTIHRPMVTRIAAVLVAGFVVISVVTHMLSSRVRSVIGGAACYLGTDLSKGDEALQQMMPPSESAPAAAPAEAGDIVALQSLGYAGPKSGKPANEQPNDRDTRSRRGKGKESSALKGLTTSWTSLNTETQLLDAQRPMQVEQAETPDAPDGGSGGGTVAFGIGNGSTKDEVGFETKFQKAAPIMKLAEKKTDGWSGDGKGSMTELGGSDVMLTYGDISKGPSPKAAKRISQQAKIMNGITLTPATAALEDRKGGKLSHEVGDIDGHVTAEGRRSDGDDAKSELGYFLSGIAQPSAPAKVPAPQPPAALPTEPDSAPGVKSTPSAFLMRKAAAPAPVALPGLGGTSGKTDPAATPDVNGPVGSGSVGSQIFVAPCLTDPAGKTAADKSGANNALNNELVQHKLKEANVYDAAPNDNPPIRDWNNSFRRKGGDNATVKLKGRTDKLAKESGSRDGPVVEALSMDEPTPILGDIPITGRLFSHGGMNAREPEKQMDAVSTAEASKLNVTVPAGSRSSPLQDADEKALEGGAMRRRVTEDSGSLSSPLKSSAAQVSVAQNWNPHDYKPVEQKEEKDREKNKPAANAPVSLVLAQRDLKKTLGEVNRSPAGEITTVGGKPSSVVDYRIKSGETLSGIAKHYGWGTKDLAELNGLQNADSIKAGATILVPVTPPGDEQVVQRQQTEKEPTGPVFKAVGLNPFVNVNVNAFSTFSMDVDTASYTLARNYMLKGFLPPAESVRTEDFINFFDYAYKPPADKLFSIYTDCAPTPFQRGLHLLKIGVEGKRLAHDEKRRAVLTFVIDTSGSMSEPDRLGLIQKSLRLLIDQLDPADSVAIVQYDSHARLVLDRTMIKDKKAILAALDSLQTSGSTNLEEGMREAYKLAARRFVPGAANRVLLLSDGAANLGSTQASDILAQVESCRKQGIYCSVFGFGIGTYNDDMLKTLAGKGDGTYAFIDSMDEAKRVFVEQLTGTLNVIAADAKIQVEFNPERVKRYRQIGYEERQLKKEQFRDDTVDAGEVGSGQSVTALYEVELTGKQEGPIGTVRVRYKNTESGKVEEIARQVGQADICRTFESTDVRFKLAAGVAEFSEILRGSDFAKNCSYKDVATVLRPVALELNLDNRLQELLRMVQAAPSMPRAEVK